MSQSDPVFPSSQEVLTIGLSDEERAQEKAHEEQAQEKARLEPAPEKAQAAGSTPWLYKKRVAMAIPQGAKKNKTQQVLQDTFPEANKKAQASSSSTSETGEWLDAFKERLAFYRQQEIKRCSRE